MWCKLCAKRNSAADTSTGYAAGLYAPFTLDGTIIVDGVLASVHSDWFLDGIFDALSLTSALPAAYQASICLALAGLA